MLTRSAQMVAARHRPLQLGSLVALVDLVDALFKHYFEIDTLAASSASNSLPAFDYQRYTKYMECVVHGCFGLFASLVEQVADASSSAKDEHSYAYAYDDIDSSAYDAASVRLLAKLVQLFNNIAPNVYDKLVRLLYDTRLVGHHHAAIDAMTLDQLFA